jgi:cell division protein FtsN
MPRDYAKRGSSRKRSPKNASHFGLWVLFLGLFAVFTFGLVYLGKHKPPVYSKPPLSPPPKVLNETKAAAVPKFDFYTLLPSTPKGNNHIKKAEYELEVAMVKDYTAADHLKAELTLLGFAVSITPIREDNTQKYCISVGPYNNQESAAADLERLKHNKISGKIKKMR